jgi:hypothetical protein
VNNTALHRNTRGQTAALVETTGNGSLVAIFATGGAVLALVGSLLGSLAAASRSSGVSFGDEFRMKRHPWGSQTPASETGIRRDETTILPPTH